MGIVNVDQDARVHEKNDFVLASMNTAIHAIQSINGMLDPGGRVEFKAARGNNRRWWRNRKNWRVLACRRF